MSEAAGYQTSAAALAELARAFKVNGDTLTAASMALEAAEAVQLALLWGPAGKLVMVAYEINSQKAILSLNCVATTLTTVGDAVAALAMQYGASESDTAGLFDQIM